MSFLVPDTLAVWSELNKRTELTASQSTKKVDTILETAKRDHKETQAPEQEIDDNEDCSDNGSDGREFSDNEVEQESWSVLFLSFSLVNFVYSVSSSLKMRCLRLPMKVHVFMELLRICASF